MCALGLGALLTASPSPLASVILAFSRDAERLKAARVHHQNAGILLGLGAG
jgi:hypothetical protein